MFEHDMKHMNPMMPVIPGIELAEAWVLYQSFHTTYTPEEGLVRGTIFPELNRPYEPNPNIVHYY